MLKHFVLHLILGLSLTTPIYVSGSEELCSNLFRKAGNEVSEKAFRHAFGPSVKKMDSLMARAEEFQRKWPQQVKLIDDVTFKFVEDVGSARRRRKMLAISLKDMESEQVEKFLDDYTNYFSWNAVSFPLGEKGGHLHTRIGYMNLDFYETFGFADYRFPTTRRLETILELSDEEFAALRQYADNIEKKGFEKIIGELDHGGPRALNPDATLSENLPAIGGHNCTSWIATAPIGKNGETLQSMLGLGAYNVHTHPGWWTAGIQTMGDRSRVPYVIYISRNESLDEIERMASGNTFKWDYDLH